jgi:hypothetical protein
MAQLSGTSSKGTQMKNKIIHSYLDVLLGCALLFAIATYLVR